MRHSNLAQWDIVITDPTLTKDLQVSLEKFGVNAILSGSKTQLVSESAVI